MVGGKALPLPFACPPWPSSLMRHSTCSEFGRRWWWREPPAVGTELGRAHRTGALAKQLRVGTARWAFSRHDLERAVASASVLDSFREQPNSLTCHAQRGKRPTWVDARASNGDGRHGLHRRAAKTEETVAEFPPHTELGHAVLHRSTLGGPRPAAPPAAPWPLPPPSTRRGRQRQLLRACCRQPSKTTCAGSRSGMAMLRRVQVV
eukprot:COSAG03_NODE_40_length_17307_cov_3.149457_9_plen_206_part_00